MVAIITVPPVVQQLKAVANETATPIQVMRYQNKPVWEVKAGIDPKTGKELKVDVNANTKLATAVAALHLKRAPKNNFGA